MGQVLHGSARTTAAIRRTIQRSQESLSKLAERFDLNPKTVAKWKKRKHVQDASMGPKHPCSTVLTPEEEATVVAFRKHTLLPLDDFVRPSGEHPAPDALVVTSLFGTPRDQSTPSNRWEEVHKKSVQTLSAGVLPH